MVYGRFTLIITGRPPTEKNRPNLGNRRLNVPAVYIMPQLGHCQHAPSLPGRADTYPHPLISLMLMAFEKLILSRISLSRGLCVLHSTRRGSSSVSKARSATMTSALGTLNRRRFGMS